LRQDDINAEIVLYVQKRLFGLEAQVHFARQDAMNAENVFFVQERFFGRV
jgi:hypothetical protein